MKLLAAALAALSLATAACGESRFSFLDEESQVEFAVRTYVSAVVEGKPLDAFVMLSETCQRRVGLEGMEALSEAAVAKSFQPSVARYETLALIGDTARVRYRSGLEEAVVEQEWVREDAEWRLDDC